MANSVDPDQMPHSLASDLGLHCLQRPICPNYIMVYTSSEGLDSCKMIWDFFAFLQNQWILSNVSVNRIRL